MLGKLIKYDFKREFKSLIPLYGIVLVLPIIIRLMNFITEKVSAFSIISSIVMTIYVIALVGLFFYTFFNSIKNFLNNVLKDEGYLTHTLPVKKSSIIISKEITAMATIVISIVIIGISLFCAFYDGTPIATLCAPVVEVVEQLAYAYGMSITECWIFWIALMVIGYMGYITTFHLALILGQTRNANRIVFSIVYGIIIYIVLQILSMIGLGINLLLKPELLDLMEEVNDLSIIIDSMRLVLYTQLIVAFITPIATHFISCAVIKKKLNLE